MVWNYEHRDTGMAQNLCGLTPTSPPQPSYPTNSHKRPNDTIRIAYLHIYTL